MPRALLIGFFLTLALSGALAIVGDPQRWPEPEIPPHQGEAADAGNGGRTHSVAALARLVREPQNTWSNLAFVFGGAWLATTGTGALARRMGVALIGVGIGSFLYHASASRTLRHLDVGAMYWLFLLAGAFSLGTLLPKLRGKFDDHANSLTVAALLGAVALTLGRNVRIAGFKPFSLTLATALAAALLIGALGAATLRRRTRSTTAAALGIVVVFALAVACQLNDQPGRAWFAPGAGLQAHALWHVLAATAFVAVVRVLDCADAPSAPAHGGQLTRVSR